MKSLPYVQPKPRVLLQSIFLALIGLALFVLLAGCGSDPQALYEKKCGTCHGLDIIDDAPHKGDQWADVVKDMQDKTTTISDDDATAITDYLASR